MSNKAVLAITLLSMVGMAFCQDTPDIDAASAKLLRACEENNVGLVIEAIEEGADVNVTNERGMTPLVWADDVAIVKLLIQHGAKVDVEWEYRTIVGEAIGWRSPEIVSAILDTGDVPSEDLDQGFIRAIRVERRDVAEMLLDHGADINNATGYEGYTALHTAVELDSRKWAAHWVRWLLERGAADSMSIGDENGFQPIHTALALGRTELAELLFEAGYSCYYSMSQLAATGELAAVRQRIEETPSAVRGQDTARWSPLYWAVAMKNAAVAEELMAGGASPFGPVDRRELPALYYACATNQADLVAIMLKSPEGDFLRFPSKTSLACLMRAAALPDTAILEQLLDHGLNPAWIVTLESQTGGTVGGNGNGPIHVAAMCGNVPAMRLLVERGAGVNTPGDQLQRPLHFAVSSRQLAASKWLLENGADANAVVEPFGPPLAHLYIYRGLAGPDDLAIEALLKQYGGKATWMVDGIRTEIARPDNFGQVAGD
jgi:ankyrin repeat protein